MALKVIVDTVENPTVENTVCLLMTLWTNGRLGKKFVYFYTKFWKDKQIHE